MELKTAHAGQQSRPTSNFSGIRSEYNCVENFGYQLPILISEVLNLNEKNISIKYADNNWAWMVHGRRLLLWQYREGNNAQGIAERNKDTTRKRMGAAQCRELTLPHSDIGHKASLVSVFLGENHHMASCIAVSPTGDIRFWSSIAHDGCSVDTTGIMDGQEFDQLIELPHGNGYILVTTTCALSMVQIQFANGRHFVQHKSLKPPSGFLTSFGKKFASIIIGTNTISDKEHKFVSISCEVKDENIVCTVVSDRMIQRWGLKNGMVNLLCEDIEIVRKIRDEFHEKFWNVRENTNIELSLLDMQLYEGSIYVLAGAVNTVHTPQMFYSIAELSNDSNGMMRLVNFVPLKLSQFYNTNTKENCLGFRFIICRAYIYVYNDKLIYPLNLSNFSSSENESQKIEFFTPDDTIMNGIVCGQNPIFFSRIYGFVRIIPYNLDTYDCMHMYPMEDLIADQSQRDPNTTSTNNLCMYHLDPEGFKELKDSINQLKAAFLYNIKHNYNMCNCILNEFLQNLNAGHLRNVESNDLDRIVMKVIKDLAEDIPAADPRWNQMWNQKDKNTLGSSYSLQILTQIKEKKLALQHFIDFLHTTELWNKLNAITIENGDIHKSTCHAISDIQEKIVAAITLRTIHPKYSKIIDETIESVLEEWNEVPHGDLTAQDIFYVRIDRIQDFFHALCEKADVFTSSRTSATTSVIYDMNTIVLNIIHSILKYREQNIEHLAPVQHKRELFEYMPWTAMSGKLGLCDSLMRLINVTIQYGIRYTSGKDLKQKLYQQILELVDIVLDGKRRYLESLQDAEKFNVFQEQYETQRRDLINLLITDGQYENATKLAEKYLDFQSLVTICDKTNNQERLNHYILKYESYNFSEFAINWHLRQNRQSEVFKHFKGNQIALSQFMRDQPTLGWIQLIFNNDFDRASKMLFELAHNETEYLRRKKSILSLAKLATFAATDSDITTQVSNINTELTVVDFQEQLNANLLESIGCDVSNQRVLQIEEIINMFISEENENANEFDFRKALELQRLASKSISFDNANEIKLKIWCMAILKDNWVNYDMNNANSYLQNLLFFKLIELCHLLDGEINSILPPIDELLNSTELSDLSQHMSFQYLLKLTYEIVMDSYMKLNEDNNI